MPFSVPLELIVLVILHLQDEATLVIDSGLAEEVLFQLLVFVAEINYVQAEVLVVLSQAGILLLLHDEIALKSYEFNLEISTSLQRFREGYVKLLNLFEAFLIIGIFLC